MSREMPIHPADEEHVAAEMARELDDLAAAGGFHVSDDFADRVMAAVAAEPLPQPVRALGVALLAGHLRSAAAAVESTAKPPITAATTVAEAKRRN